MSAINPFIQFVIYFAFSLLIVWAWILTMGKCMKKKRVDLVKKFSPLWALVITIIGMLIFYILGI